MDFLASFLLNACTDFPTVQERLVIIDHVVLAKQGDNALGSVRMSVSVSVGMFV